MTNTILPDCSAKERIGKYERGFVALAEPVPWLLPSPSPAAAIGNGLNQTQELVSYVCILLGQCSNIMVDQIIS
jgi:hypothetical protein